MSFRGKIQFKMDDPVRRMPLGGDRLAEGQIKLLEDSGYPRARSTSATGPTRNPNVRNCLPFLTQDGRAIRSTDSS